MATEGTEQHRGKAVFKSVSSVKSVDFSPQRTQRAQSFCFPPRSPRALWLILGSDRSDYHDHFPFKTYWLKVRLASSQMVAAKSSMLVSPLRTAVTAGPITASNSGQLPAHRGPSVAGLRAKPFRNAWLLAGGEKVRNASSASWLTRLGTFAPNSAILP